MSGQGPVMRRDEQGAALVVALVLVLISALLGVSVLESSSMESRLVDNDKIRADTFRAAEAASESALTSLNVQSLIETGSTTSTVTQVDDAITIDVQPRLDGCAHVLNSSIGLFQNFLYSATATATISGVDSTRTVVQGASQRVPAMPAGFGPSC